YRPESGVPTTLARQLAQYVVIYSPLQMAADLPENYEGQPALKFIEDVPVDWDTTIAVNGEIGAYVTIARKDRHSADWYLGSVTDEEERVLDIPFSFLDESFEYVAEIYRDGPAASWQENNEVLVMETRLVEAGTSYRVQLAPGGGLAIRFRPAGEDERATMERLP
ncbi:MAG: glycoside hydrolase family 97 C-terminal domain-containing protein, partial [Rhodothermales bacterium]